MKQLDTRRILIVPDLHFPANHVDSFAFLQKLKDTIKPTLVVCIGDMLDHHNLSRFERNPNLPGALDELNLARKGVKRLHKIFPKMIIVRGNHDLRPQHLARRVGLPEEYLKDMPTLLNIPHGWDFRRSLTVELPTGQEVLFAHDLGRGIRTAVGRHAMCIVSGHYHTKMKITYSPNKYNLNWGMFTGCLIDDDHGAMDYMKNTSDLKKGKSVLGTGAILDGKPTIFPMMLKKGGRWTKKL